MYTTPAIRQRSGVEETHLLHYICYNNDPVIYHSQPSSWCLLKSKVQILFIREGRGGELEGKRERKELEGGGA